MYPTVVAISVATLNVLLIFIQGNIDAQLFLLPHKIAVGLLASILPFIAAHIQSVVFSLRSTVEQITEENNAVNTIFQNYEKRTYFGGKANLLPMMFVLPGLPSLIALGIPWQGTAAFAYEGLIGIFLLLTGTVGWLFLSVVITFREITQLETIGEIFHWPAKHIQQLSNKFLEIFVLGVFIYLGAILSVWLIPWGTLLLLETFFGYLWVLPLASIVIFYFVLAQYYVHLIFKSSKGNRLSKDRWAFGKFSKREAEEGARF